MKHQPINFFASSSSTGAQVGTAKAGYPPNLVFYVTKRTFDLILCLFLAIIFILTAFVLIFLNPFLNKGSLFFVQIRMGRDCVPFKAIKFRSMTKSDKIVRGVNDPLEMDRITRLGQFLRQSRLDEIPQIINVVAGDMSLIGPRPDFIDHAEVFVRTIPEYKERHSVRPGISGYAQTEVGYAATIEATRKKVAADLTYIRNRSLRFEAWIVWRTIQTIVGRKGS